MEQRAHPGWYWLGEGELPLVSVPLFWGCSGRVHMKHRVKLNSTNGVLSWTMDWWNGVYEQKFNFRWTPTLTGINTDLATRFCLLWLRSEFETTVCSLTFGAHESLCCWSVTIWIPSIFHFDSWLIVCSCFRLGERRFYLIRYPALRKQSCTPLPCSLVKYRKGLSKMLTWHI